MKPMLPKDVALFIIPFITAPISLLSSSYVVYLIYKNTKMEGSKQQRRRSKPREHILLGMSLMDIIFSFGLSFSTLPGPAIYETRLPTAGTVQTCTAQGFFVQLGLGAPLYNACLCVYFLLRVRYKVTDEYLMKWAIPVMHLIILSFSFGTAISGIVLKLFNYAGVMGCWIHPVNNLCDIAPEYCDRGQRADEFVMYFGLIHVALCFLFVLVSMIILSCHVYRTESKSRQWEISAVSSCDNMSIDSRATNGTTARRKAAKRARAKMNLTRKTIKTGILYSASFLIVWLPTIILGAVPPEIGKTKFYASIQILAVVLQPFQGLMNMMIYTSPDWIPQFRLLFCCCFCCWCNPNGGYGGGDEDEGDASSLQISRVSGFSTATTRAAIIAAANAAAKNDHDGNTTNRFSIMASKHFSEDGTQSFAAAMSNCSSSKFDNDDDDDSEEGSSSMYEEMKRKLEEHRNNNPRTHIELTMGCPPNISGFTCSEDDDEEEWDEDDEAYDEENLNFQDDDDNNNKQEEKHEITARDSPSTTQNSSSSQFLLLQQGSSVRGDLQTTSDVTKEEEEFTRQHSNASIKMCDFSGQISSVDLSSDDDDGFRSYTDISATDGGAGASGSGSGSGAVAGADDAVVEP